MKSLGKILTISLVFCSGNAFAIDLGIPIACNYGIDCFIESYFDHIPEEGGYNDHTCGILSSDGHVSTDFKLLNHEQMKDGVNVVASDSGIIKYVRDGMSDISVKLIGEEAVRGRECGNGVVIQHPRGYITQYCHLKQNSIPVKKGDKIEKGQTIGEVGLSGISSFPFLEFTVTVNGKPVDPFTGEDPVTGEVEVACDSLDIYPLWDKQTEKNLGYISTALLSAGFAKRVPHAQGAREGKFGRETIGYDARLLVFWLDIFGIMEGDDLVMKIIDPDGKELSNDTRNFKQNRRHMFQFMGLKPESEHWPLGEYKGQIELLRKEAGYTEKVVEHEVIIDIIDPDAVVENTDDASQSDQ